MFFKKDDVIGNALTDYIDGNNATELILYSNIKINKRVMVTGVEKISVASFFSDFSSMKEVDRMVLEQCYGKVLDIGAGAGSHSLVLANKGIDVYSLDISPGAVDVMKRRGLKKVFCGDINKFNIAQFDTLVFFGNNHGIFGDIESFDKFLHNIAKLLKSTGQILIASPYNNILINNTDKEILTSYIRLNMCLEYNGLKSKSFRWFMIDPIYMSDYFKQNGWIFKTTICNQKDACMIRITNLY